MSGELTIRPAHSEDAAAILAYLRQIGAESDNLTFGPEGLPITEEQERQYLRQVENDPDALMLVAQEADEIVALCGLSRPRRPRMSHRAQIDAWPSACAKAIGTRALPRKWCSAWQSGPAVWAPKCWSCRCFAAMRRPFMCMKSWAFARWGGWNDSFASTANTTPPC